MTLKPPVLITLGVVAATAALIALKAPQRPRNPPPAIQAGGPSSALGSVDSSPARSPNLAAPGGHDAPPIGDFVYLFDVSGSTKTAAKESAFEEGLKLLRPIFDALRGLDELAPERHRVATIGAMSLHREPRCDIYVASRTLFTETDSMAPVRALRACEDSLRAAPAEPYTDISGALFYAGLSLQGDRPAMRGVVLVTDLDEDRAPGTTAAVPDLRGLCVVGYTLVTTEVARDPHLLEQRQHEWQERLTQWGARRVRLQNALSFDPADLQAFFRSCEVR